MTTITTIDGTQIYYKVRGSGQPVVFSHGCHGSRFDTQGHLVCGPANHDLAPILEV